MTCPDNKYTTCPVCGQPMKATRHNNYCTLKCTVCRTTIQLDPTGKVTPKRFEFFVPNTQWYDDPSQATNLERWEELKLDVLSFIQLNQPLTISALYTQFWRPLGKHGLKELLHELIQEGRLATRVETHFTEKRMSQTTVYYIPAEECEAA